MISFARKVKDELCELPVKSTCCRASLLYGFLQFSTLEDDGAINFTTENENVLSLYEKLLIEVISGECEIDYYGQGYRLSITGRDTLFSVYSRFGDLNSFNNNVFKCEFCRRHYFRGAFLCRGTVNSLDAPFHLEIDCPNLGADTFDLLKPIGIRFKYSTRARDGKLYLKDGGSIESFLHYIEARSAAFAVSEEIIMREIRSKINRQNNFEVANQQRTIDAGSKYTNAINKLRKSNMLSSLPPDLQITAELKMKYPDVPLSELAGLHDPKISKSGLYHRLERLVEAANEL